MLVTTAVEDLWWTAGRLAGKMEEAVLWVRGDGGMRAGAIHKNPSIRSSNVWRTTSAPGRIGICTRVRDRDSAKLAGNPVTTRGTRRRYNVNDVEEQEDWSEASNEESTEFSRRKRK
jgi:hypothetical protein